MTTDDPQTPPGPTRMPLPGWLHQGLRVAVLQKPEIGRSAPTPWQLLLLVCAAALLQTGLGRLEVQGPAQFILTNWLYQWCLTGFLVFLIWAFADADPAAHPAPVPAWLALGLVAWLPAQLLGQLVLVLHAHGALPAWWNDAAWVAWGEYVLSIWMLVIALHLSATFMRSTLRRALLVLCLLVLEAVSAWNVASSRPWFPPDAGEEGAKAPLMRLDQDLFEEQQVLLASSLAALQPGAERRAELYGLVYAPYAQDVFLREAGMVASVLQQRFDAKGRVLQLVNHPNTAHTIAWATNQNLHKAIQAMAEAMDREHDVLLLYMTSHGGSDFQLASEHPPLAVDPLTPQMLRAMLDEAGIRNRVLVVSACYSGGWVEPLQSDTTLVMTAADVTHTSYGCGAKSELTFFGRAVFDEQLRQTHSFEEAFNKAVPVIAQREIEGKKSDGFSNPQIAVGAGIRPVLAQLERDLSPPNKP